VELTGLGRYAIRRVKGVTRAHRVIQEAMGWRECHLHDFRIADREYACRIRTTGSTRSTSARSASATL